MTLVEGASLVVSAAGVVVGVLSFVTFRRFSVALAAALELLTAAGLLRLSADGTWRAVATAGAIVVTRRLVGAALR